MNELKNIPEEMRKQNKWVGFKLIYKDEKEKPVKLPISPYSGKGASSVNEKDWGSFDDAVTACKKYMCSGVGYVFNGDGIVGIDIDNCIDDNGEFNNVAKAIMAMTDSYTEFSPSKHGVHIYVRGSLDKAVKNSESGVELYSTGRYFTVTGNQIGNKSEVLNAQIVIDFITEKYGKKPKEKPAVEPKINMRSGVDLADSEVIQLASKAKNGSDFTALYKGDWKDKYSSQSEADLSFCNLLAFWCGKNKSQIDSIFRSSGLMRDKWNEMRGANTYGNMTISEAVANCRDVYTKPSRAKKREPRTELDMVEEDGCYFMMYSNGNSVKLSNFTIRVEKILQAEEESYVYCKVKTQQGKEFSKTFATKDFNSLQAFKRVLNSNTLDLVYKGKDSSLESLKELISMQNAPIVQASKGINIVKIGNEHIYSGEHYAINKNDDVSTSVQLLASALEISSEIEKREEFSTYELQQLGEILLEYNILPRTACVLAWCASCFLKSRLKNKGVKFPHLMLIGEQGSGKSSTFEKVIAPFFSSSESVAAGGATKFTIIKASGSSNCIPFVVDEFKPSTMDKGLVHHYKNMLRSSYDGQSALRGQVDLSSKKLPYNSPVCIIGEESAEESAIRERSIELLFSKKDLTSKFGFAEKLDRNKEQIQMFGKAVLLASLGLSESQIKNMYNEAIDKVEQDLPPRIRNNIAVLFCGLELVSAVCKKYSMTFQKCFAMEIDKVQSAIVKGVKDFMLSGGMYNKTVVDKTIEVFDRMGSLYSSGVHYKAMDKGNFIAFNIKGMYDSFTKYVKEHSIAMEVLTYEMFIKQLQQKDYYKIYKNVSYATGQAKSFVVDTRKLSACADIGNLLYAMKIDLPETEQTRMEF